MQNLSFFENIKLYVGFTDASSAALRELHPIALPFFQPIVDDFYAAIEDHPGASQAITGGQAQIARLKQTLVRWMDKMLLGPHDEEYYELRARIGRMHVRIALPQQYMFTAMDRIRVRLLDVVRTQIADDSGKVERIATAVNQILDLELAIMLETYREDLEAKHRNNERLATIGQFAASIGHELRNPLGVVESSLYLLRQHLKAEAEAPSVKKHLDRIGSEVVRANKTIHDLLDLARNRPPQKRSTSLHQLVESAAEAALLPAAVTLHVSVPADLTLLIDPDQIRQVLANLFTNAAQALKGRGQIWVEAEPIPGGGARLRVRDDGPGISAEDRGRVFEALFTTKAKGSGLGLALCRRIIEAHGGTIEIEPRSDGASFLIAFAGG
ncbi:MAG TPA: protoglobin domain-containing protein, partial [Polyangia bacterium]|nr:protoglobin domain-containing protein [Polyangia bacterium]